LLSVLQKLNEPNRDGKLTVIQSIGGGLIGYRPNVAESFGGKLRTLKERDSLGSTNLPSALGIGCRKESFKVGPFYRRWNVRKATAGRGRSHGERQFSIRKKYGKKKLKQGNARRQ
jgi:hypothetical protein